MTSICNNTLRNIISFPVAQLGNNLSVGIPDAIGKIICTFYNNGIVYIGSVGDSLGYTVVVRGYLK